MAARIKMKLSLHAFPICIWNIYVHMTAVRRSEVDKRNQSASCLEIA